MAGPGLVTDLLSLVVLKNMLAMTPDKLGLAVRFLFVTESKVVYPTIIYKNRVPYIKNN